MRKLFRIVKKLFLSVVEGIQAARDAKAKQVIKGT